MNLSKTATNRTAKTKVLLNALQLPVLINAKFVVEVAVGDDANGTLSLTYHYVSALNPMWKSASRTITIRGFLTYLIALNLVSAQIVTKPAISTIYASSIKDLKIFQDVFELKAFNNFGNPEFKPEVTSFQLLTNDDLTGSISLNYTLGFKTKNLTYQAAQIRTFSSSGF